MQRRSSALSATFALWVAAHMAYFRAFHQALELPFTSVSAAFAALFALWTFALVAPFRSRWARGLAIAMYAAAMAATLLDYAHFQVFGTFLPLSWARLGSMNGPMVALLKEYLFLIPTGLAAGAAVLVAAAVGMSRFLSRRLHRETLDLSLLGERRTYFHGAASHAVVGIGFAAQIAALAVSVVAADAYRAGIGRDGRDPSLALADLGAFGYALAAERGAVSETAGSVAPSAGAGLTASRSNVEAARGALEELYRSSPAAPRTVPDLPRLVAPPHVVVYQMESVAAWPLEQEPSPMPFLDSLMEKYGTAGEYVANGCTTVDAEFAVNCGFLPESNGPVSDLYSRNGYRCLPSLLKERGYATALYHANDARFWSRDVLAPAWGFDSLRFKPEIPYREPDADVMDLVVADLAAAERPTYAYVIGFTSHSPHDAELQDYYRTVHGVEVPSYAGPLGPVASGMDADESTIRSYLGFLGTADAGLRRLFEGLRSQGLLDRTVVVAFGDHRYYDSSATDPLRRFRDYDRLPFLLYAPGMAPADFGPVASHVDVAPTLQHLIAGSESGLPDSFIGRSLYAAGRPAGAVTKCLGRVSYYDGSSVTSGDLRLGALQTFPASADPANARLGPIRRLVDASDLAFKRNELGSDAVPTPLSPDDKAATATMADTDGDGLSDLREHAIGTDPRRIDTDDDGYPDGVEAANGFDPLGPGRWYRGSSAR